MDSPFGSSVSKALGGILAGLPIGSEEVRTASFLRSRFTGRLDDEGPATGASSNPTPVSSDAAPQPVRHLVVVDSQTRGTGCSRCRVFSGTCDVTEGSKQRASRPSVPGSTSW